MDDSESRETSSALGALTPAMLRELRRHILAVARKAEQERYRERMAALRGKKMALPPRRRKTAASGPNSEIPAARKSRLCASAHPKQAPEG